MNNTKPRDKKEKFTRVYVQLSEQKGMSTILSRQLLVLSLVVLAFTFINWFFWGRYEYSDHKLSSFHWYVMYPFALELITSGLSVLTAYILEKKHDFDEKYGFYPSIFLGSFFYSAFFFTIVFFYSDINVFWLFAMCPILLAALYRDVRWMLTTLAYSMVAILAILLIPYEGLFDSSTPSKVVLIIDVLLISQLVSHFAIAIRNLTEMAIARASEAEATKKAKEDFFARMSHEIRTPINAVLGMDEMILREETSPEVEAYALNIKDAGQSLLTLINDILDSSKLQVGKLEIVPVDYDLLSVLNDCINMLKMRAKDKGLSLTVTNDHSVPRMLNGDEVRIRQVLLNILANAIKYTTVGSVELDVAWKRIDRNTMDLILSVKDTGMGIAEEAMPRLFNSFERLDEKKTKYIEGTGLGLSITKQLVDLMGGHITVESKLGEGSTFTITIPQKIVGMLSIGDFYKTVESASGKGEKYKEKFVAPDANLLVVDDVQMNIDVFKGLLKKNQVQIDAASSGKQALELCKTKEYDIIFMDHLMPEMDGVEALQYIKTTVNLNENTPVVALTANAGPGSEDIYKNLGFDDYMSKPIKGKLLEEMVYKYISAKSLSKEVVVKTVDKITTSEPPADIRRKFNFLDIDEALENCGGSESLFIEILDAYREDSKILNLSRTYQDMNLKDYAVYVHGLKSASKSIGAMDLSEEARLLELAAKAGDTEYITSHHADMMAHYENLLGKLSALLTT